MKKSADLPMVNPFYSAITKIQDTRYKQIPNSKFQSPKLVIGFWLLVIICYLFLGYCSFAAAQDKDLVINGDNVSYDKANHLVEAQGSVEVIYKDVLIHGDHIIFRTDTEMIVADNGFDINYEGVTIEGFSLDYAIKTKKGKATNVKFTFHGIELDGREIEFTIDEFKLKNASFTTCDLDGPHYHVTAGEVILYPEYGWLVAYWGWFWLGRFPIVPMPTYIYDMYAEQKNRRNLPPFPEIGSNDEDGTYINERLAWHIRRELSGTYSITYATKKGLGGGAEANYILNDNNQGNVRGYGNAGDGLWGGITHRILFGGEVEGEGDIPFTFLASPKYRQYEFETTLSHRERINYQRVSYTPDLVLRSRKGHIIREEAQYDAEVGASMIAEENNVSLGRTRGNINFYWDFPETAIGDITPSVGLDSRFYSNGTRWVKTTGGIDLKKTFAQNLLLGVGYLHYFEIDGTSPFNFELYRFNPADRLKSNLFFVIGETGIGIDTSYYLDTWQPEDIDYSLIFRMHCYDLIVKYRSLRREFELGFGLVGG